MSFTASEIDTRIEETDGWDNVADELCWKPALYDLEGYGRLEYVELTEDGTDRMLVFKIGDRLFAKSGYHSSYDGGEWDGSCEEVERFEYQTHGYRPVR